jgi:phosphate/phosphite/phosphonate ABC transporter binding protein
VASSKSRLPVSPRQPAVSSHRASSKAKIATRRSLVFGMIAPPASSSSPAAAAHGDLGPNVDRLLRWTAKRAGFDLELHQAATYEALAKDMTKGRVDVAWLPPIVRVRLGDDAVPLGSILRDGRMTYETALIVRSDSKVKTIAQLRKARAGWVDRWSAAGYVLPRVNLALFGIDAPSFFGSETFYGSHRGVVAALLAGACDVAGTYAQADAKGKVRGGAWSEVDGADVRVIATFGAIPPDVIAARADLAEPQRDAVRDALHAASTDAEGKKLLRAVFGGETFVEDMSKSYESLARALEIAAARGLFDGAR